MRISKAGARRMYNRISWFSPKKISSHLENNATSGYPIPSARSYLSPKSRALLRALEGDERFASLLRELCICDCLFCIDYSSQGLVRKDNIFIRIEPSFRASRRLRFCLSNILPAVNEMLKKIWNPGLLNTNFVVNR